MNCKITVIPGDGIGPEIIEEAIKAIKVIGEKYNHRFELKYVKMGGCAIDEFGVPLPKSTLKECKNSDAVLLGAVGGYKWDKCPAEVRPEKGLLQLREGLNLFCNLRPALLYEPLKNASPLKDSLIKDGIDISVVRELTGGIYFGDRGRKIENGVISAYDTERYNEIEIKRIVKVAFETAMKRRKKLTSVDKANVLESSRLWRATVDKVSKEYGDVEVNHMYVDNAAMQLVREPNQFDVIVTSNLFGDILSDEASMVTGSIGMLPSASLGEGKLGVYEPIHGSAPDIAGMNIANPLATILSAAMMLRYSFDLEKEARTIENAVINVLKKGYRTKDIFNDTNTLVGTKEMGNLVVDEIRNM